MYLKLFSIIMVSFFPLLISSQNFEWEGYGKGLSYLKISNGYVLFNSYISSDSEVGKLKEVNDHWIIYEVKDQDFDTTYQRRISILNSNYDSLSINIQGIPVIYYKPRHLEYMHGYRFEEFILEYLNSYSSFEFKIEFNRHGRIRYSDRENKTLFELTLDESHIDKFRDMLKYIDIANLNQSSGRISMCDNKEFVFIFKDSYRNEYKYRAILPPVQLNPIKEFLEGILKAKGHKIELPNRD